MASPSPDASAPAAAPPAPSAPASENNTQSSVPQPEQKLDTNGLPTTEAPTKPVEAAPSEPSAQTTSAALDKFASPTPAPVVNGNGSSSEHNGTNGVSHTAERSAEKTEPDAPAAEQSQDKPPAPSSIATPSPTPVQEQSEPQQATPVVSGADEKAPAPEAPKEQAKEESQPETKPESRPEPEDVKMEEITLPLKQSVVTEAPAITERDEKPSTESIPAATAPAKEEAPISEAAKESEDVKMEDAPLDSVPSPKAPEQPTSLEKHDGTALPTSEADLQPASMSQLNIATQPDTSPIIDSVEVPMRDAPAAKVAREREDDDMVEQPAPKRAKTEPEEDKPPAATSQVEKADPQEQDTPATEPAAEVAEAGSVEQVPSLDTLANWNDAESNRRVLQHFQRIGIRKTISRLKKTKGGAHFRDAVVKIWPQLREAYLAKIDNPMDLSELDRNVRDAEGPYSTFGDFKNGASLIYLNTLTFNGPSHDVTFAAFNIIKTLWHDLTAMPEEAPPENKKPANKAPRESRTASTATASAATAAEAAASRRRSSGPRGSPSTDADVKSAAGDRRGSTATEGDRPKRTVRAPKPKDIDYTTKPSRKKLKPELQFATEVLSEVMNPKYERLNMWFLEPVDAEGLNIPDYYSIIKKPMDLGKVSQMLSAGEFANLKEFDKHVRLVFENCYSFNGPPSQGNPVSLTASELEGVYTGQMKTKDAWLAKFAKANAPTSADVSDEEDEEEDVDDTVVAEDNSKEIQELSAKLAEETKKLHAMFVPGANQSMIDIQKGIVNMVEQALMKAIATAGETQAKNEKGAKKPRAPKGKSSAGRKSSSAAPGKKAGGGKKGAAKKTLTAADKDNIANAINDLEYPHLDRAIDIIKRDTGQNENNDGELELDIDQLSNDALLKLWELCKKALPDFAKDSSSSTAAPEPSRAPKPKTTAGKPKKNKPMSAQEQEDRIAQLTLLRQMYKEGGDAATGMAGSAQSPPLADSSDDSDSEEE